MGYINEDGNWKPFGSSPVSDAYWVFICEKCAENIRNALNGQGEIIEICDKCNLSNVAMHLSLYRGTDAIRDVE